MEQDDGFGFGIGLMAEVVDVAVGPQATDDLAAGCGVEGLALEADGDFAIVAHAHGGALTPDVEPPRTAGTRAEDGSFFSERLLVGGPGRLAELAMDFILVGVGEELVEQRVGAGQFADLVGGQEGREAFLPVVVAAFDFAFGLRGGGVAQGHAVEVQGRTQLGEGVRVVRVKEGVVVHVEGQGQAVGGEGPGEEVEVSQEGFARVETGADVEAGGVVEQIQQALLVGRAGQEGVGRGVVLPERTVVAGLPAFDGFGGGFEAGVGGQLVGDGPATDAGAVRFEIQAPVQFAGGGAVGRGRLGGEQFGDQGGDFGGPVALVIAAGQTGRPGVGVAVGARLEVVAVEFVEAGAGQAQFVGGGAGGELPGAVAVEQVADEGSREAFAELELFIRASLPEESGFIAGRLIPAGLAGPPVKAGPTGRLSG